jgi:hypothetical protein
LVYVDVDVDLFEEEFNHEAYDVHFFHFFVGGALDRGFPHLAGVGVER